MFRRADALVTASDGPLHSVPPGTAHLTYALRAALPDELWPALPSVLYRGSEARLVQLAVTDGTTRLRTLHAERCPVWTWSSPAPHVSLARFRSGTRQRDARDIEDAIARHHASPRLEVDVTEVLIVERRVGPSGAQAVPRATIPLARA